MTAHRTFKPADAAEQTAFARSHCRVCTRQLGCTILADAKPLSTEDNDYPRELVIDDLGRPSCTLFAATASAEPDDALPPVTAGPVPPAPAAAEPKRSVRRRPAPATPAAIPAPFAAAPPIVFEAVAHGDFTVTVRGGGVVTSTIRLDGAGAAR